MVVTVQLTGTSSGAVAATDSKGDTFAVASDTSDSSGDRLVTLSAVAANGLAVSDQITVTFPTASLGNRVTADEVSGATTVDRQSAGSGSGSTFSSGSTGTTSRAGEFVFATVGTFGGTSIGWDTGWNSKSFTSYTTGSNALGRADQVPTGTGSFTATGTASGNWLAEVVAFK